MVSENLITKPLDNFHPQEKCSENSGAFKAWIEGMDWDTQCIRIVADLTACTTTGSSQDCVFSLVGKKIADGTATGWTPDVVTLHVYYAATDDAITSVHVSGNKKTTSVTLSDKSNVVFEISKDNGLLINGMQTGATASQLSSMFTKSELTFSSEEGNGRMHGWYKSVKVEKLPAKINNVSLQSGSIKQVVSSGFVSTSGTSWNFENINVDWSTDKVIASISLGGSWGSSSAGNQIIGVAKDGITPGWTAHTCVYYAEYYNNKPVIRGYYKNSASETHNAGDLDLESANYTFTFEVGKDIYSGQSYGSFINGSGHIPADKMTDLFTNDKEVINIGSNDKPYGCTYNYIWIASKDLQVAANSTTNVLKEECVNLYDARQNTSVKIDRTFVNDGGWYTLCLPFALTAEQVSAAFGEGYELRTFSGVSGNTLNFSNENENGIQAGKPYLFKPGKDITDETSFENVNLVAPASTGMPKPTTFNGYTMQGVYGVTNLDVNGRNLILTASNKFKKVSEASHTIKGTRAYFSVPDGANFAALRVDIDNVETSVGELFQAVQSADNRVFNLQGQYVGTSLNGLQRGIYVQNGKKVVVK